MAGGHISTKSANWELVSLPSSVYSHNSIGSREYILIKFGSEALKSPELDIRQ
jgi:hypothetical protein